MNGGGKISEKNIEKWGEHKPGLSRTECMKLQKDSSELIIKLNRRHEDF